MKKLVLLISSTFLSLAALQAQEASTQEAGAFGLLSKVVRPKVNASLSAEGSTDNTTSSVVTKITNQYFWTTFTASKNLTVKPVTMGGTARVISKSPTSKVVVVSAIAHKVLVVDGPSLLDVGAERPAVITVSFD